ncbi:hypothetical protein MAMC_00038 [Methylacidimicrobium cyclopophantes]|uniref:Uncharacterized protein n=1 Tax=Methylacidimicrobium cyclopophantes TaxID=1041766 RepID=A0A5E6MFS0_9BACT|nr:hypothetical protein [Methylacidimicrobium cyclopophantes]VVM04380.1 hypothetical protein MAMC_00038 [Methylacidimicrobium cyclopophantes]
MPKWVKILQAAQAGMGWTDEELAEGSRTPLQKLRELKAGVLDSDALRRVARALHLGADALLVLAQGGGVLPSLPNLKTLRSIEMGARRGYLLWDSASRLAALIDIGGESPQAVRLLEKEFLVARYLFFTESSQPVEPEWIRFLEERSALPVRPEGEKDGTYPLGTLQVDRRLVAVGEGVSRSLYLVRGLDVPVAFIGRLLSLPDGGTEEGRSLRYRRWLEEAHSHIFTLSDETLLCPSSGPVTSVGFEKAHNPFFPEFEHFSPFASLTEENRNP